MINADITARDLPEDKKEFFLGKKFRIVTIPAGFPLWKLSSFKGSEDTVAPIGPETEAESNPKTGKFITPWWANVGPFEEDKRGARNRFEQAKLKGIRIQDEVRIANAVRIDWNGLSDYQEVVLTEPCKAFWGQFEPVNTHLTYKKLREENAKAKPKYQLTTTELTQKLNKANNALAEIRNNYLDFPDMLGGVPDAWQFYIPYLSKHYLKKQATINAHDKELIELMLG
jgi:hypothetical protein